MDTSSGGLLIPEDFQPPSGHYFVLTLVPLVEKELLILLEHLSLSQLCCGIRIRVVQSLVLCVVLFRSFFVRLYFSLFWSLYCLSFDLQYMHCRFCIKYDFFL